MSLYNNERPQTLEQVRGQEKVKTLLRGMFASGNLPNAFLFIGPRGTGKTTAARIVARYVNCEHPNGDPCNICTSCKQILSGTSVDVVELDAASNNKVEDVHGIIEQAGYAPLMKKRIYILDEVHMFSQGAWNALLKIIEEPPKDVLFILCTTEENKVPATIISRCRRLQFEKIDLQTVTEALAEICEKYGKAYDEDALKLIAKASDGCMRDALSILEAFFDVDAISTENVSSSLGASKEDVVFGILNGISSGDAMRAVEALHTATARGTSLPNLIRGMMDAVTEAMYLLQGASVEAVVNTTAYKEALASFAETIEIGRCFELTELLSEAYAAVAKSNDAEFLLEAAIMRSITHQSALEGLAARIARLEAGSRVSLEEARRENAAAVLASAEIEEETGIVVNGSKDGETTESSLTMQESQTEEVPFEEDSYAEIPTTEMKSSPKGIDDELLSHLPAGTSFDNAVTLLEALDDEADDRGAETEESRKEETEIDKPKPFVAENKNLPPIGFDLSGLLWGT